MDVIMRLISLAVGRLLENPKKTLIVLFIAFIAVLLIGEAIDNSSGFGEIFTQYSMPTHEFKDAQEYFELPEIVDRTFTPTPTATEKPYMWTKTPSVVNAVPQATPTMVPEGYCTDEQLADLKSRNSIQTDKNVRITYLGGMETTLSVRYRYTDPKVIVGTLKSDDTVYVIDGPKCFSNTRWWKINSGKFKFVGWIPEIVQGKPMIELVK